MGLEVKQVSQILGEIKNLLEHNFNNVSIEGEVTNLSLSSSGHWYFTLSDKESALSAALFKMDALRNPQVKNIKNGDKVIVVGDINVYPKRGTFQIIVKRMVAVGVGDLKEQLEKLKRRLASEGLFDLDKKKPIPPMPKRVAIVTAQRGAALQDFINIYKRRSLWMNLLVVPTLVQGDDAPRALRASLHKVIKYSMEAPTDKKIDLIVLARGGGSLEDLWAFNDEGLAYDLFNCPIPTISAIGHEVDFSISDFVCDLRCETPSAAAEVITHQQTMIKEKMLSLRNRMQNSTVLKMARLQNRLKRVSPHGILNILLKHLAAFERRLNRANIHKRLHELTKIHEFYLALDESLEKIQQVIKNKIEQGKLRSERAHGLLKVLNPKNVLERGYGYLETQEAHVIGSAEELDRQPSSSVLNLHFHDGKREVKRA